MTAICVSWATTTTALTRIPASAARTMTRTVAVGAASVNDCVAYEPLVSYQFESSGNLGLDSTGVYHATNSGVSQSVGRRGFYSGSFSASNHLVMPTTIPFSTTRSSTGLTFSFWGFVSSTAGSRATFFSLRDNSGTTTRFYFNIGTSATTGELFWVGGSLATLSIVRNMWHYFVVTVDPSNVATVYIDRGLVYGPSTISFPSITANQEYLIGRWNAGSNFVGSMDDFRVYPFPFIQFDVDQHYFPLYHPTQCTLGTFPIHSYFDPLLIASKGFPGITDKNAVTNPVGEIDALFNSMVRDSGSATIVRVCYDCDLANWLVFYKRVSDPGYQWSVSANILYAWNSAGNNQVGLDFHLVR
jgi:hypothetical protein